MHAKTVAVKQLKEGLMKEKKKVKLSSEEASVLYNDGSFRTSNKNNDYVMKKD